MSSRGNARPLYWGHAEHPQGQRRRGGRCSAGLSECPSWKCGSQEPGCRFSVLSSGPLAPLAGLGCRPLSRDPGARSRACHGQGHASQKLHAQCRRGLCILHNKALLTAPGTQSKLKIPFPSSPGSAATHQPWGTAAPRSPWTTDTSVKCSENVRGEHPAACPLSLVFGPVSRVAFPSLLCTSHDGRFKKVLETPGQNENKGSPRAQRTWSTPAPTTCSRRDLKPLRLP